MLEKFIDNDVMGFERVLRDIEKILLLMKNRTSVWRNVYNTASA